MRSPYAKVTKTVEDKTVTKTNTPDRSSIVIAILSVLLCLSVYQLYFAAPLPPDDVIVIDDPEDEDKIPDEEKVSLQDSYLVRVYETEADEQEVWMVNFLDEDAFWLDWVKSKGMKYFTFDPSSNKDQASSFIEAASKRNVSPPFVMHAKAGKVLSVVALEQSVTVDELKEIILSKGK